MESVFTRDKVPSGTREKGKNDESHGFVPKLEPVQGL